MPSSRSEKSFVSAPSEPDVFHSVPILFLPIPALKSSIYQNRDDVVGLVPTGTSLKMPTWPALQPTTLRKNAAKNKFFSLITNASSAPAYKLRENFYYLKMSNFTSQL